MALEKYHFVSGDGETKLDVHYLNDKLSFKQANALRKKHKDDNEALSEAFMKAALTKEEFTKVEELSLRDYQRFMSEWAEAEDTSVGES